MTSAPAAPVTGAAGETSGAVIYGPAATQNPVTVRPVNRVQWGPVWAGLMTALTSFLVIQLFLYWVGAIGVTTSGGGGAVPARDGWISAIVAICAFFLGGWVATASTNVRGAGSGALNGFIVWALGVVLILAFSAAGVGSVFGAAGASFGQFATMGRSGITLPTGETTTALRQSAGWGLLFLLLSAAAGAIGGWIGDRPTLTGPAVETAR
jgi:hypothetical protein